jgi:hypothetical protein
LRSSPLDIRHEFTDANQSTSNAGRTLNEAWELSRDNLPDNATFTSGLFELQRAASQTPHSLMKFCLGIINRQICLGLVNRARYSCARHPRLP